MGGPRQPLLADMLQGVPSNPHDGTPGERGTIDGLSYAEQNLCSMCVAPCTANAS